MSRLKEIRESERWSISKIANEAGVSRQTIYDLEAGKRQGKLETWLKLATILDTPVEELSGKSFEELSEYEGKVLAL